MIVFDMDGVLVDSRSANREAYRRAGVYMPDWAWGLPWHEWLTNPFQHARKRELYTAMIHRGEVEPLSGVDLLRWASERGEVRIITSSSGDTAKLLLQQLALPSEYLLRVSCSKAEKREALIQHGARVYVDDIALNATITDKTKCGFVHYVPGTEDRMKKEIEQWTP